MPSTLYCFALPVTSVSFFCAVNAQITSALGTAVNALLTVILLPAAIVPAEVLIVCFSTRECSDHTSITSLLLSSFTLEALACVSIAAPSSSSSTKSPLV